VSGSGTSWAVCKSAPCPRQITTPTPHHSVFLQAGCPSCRPTNSVKALTGRYKSDYKPITIQWCHICHISYLVEIRRAMWPYIRKWMDERIWHFGFIYKMTSKSEVWNYFALTGQLHKPILYINITQSFECVCYLLRNTLTYSCAVWHADVWRCSVTYVLGLMSIWVIVW